MAINYGFSSENAKALLLKLGVDKDLLKSVFAFGWGVKLTANELVFVKDLEHHVVPLDLATMQKLSAGTLSAAALTKISKDVDSTVALIINQSAQAAAGVLDDLPQSEPVSAPESPKITAPGLTFTGPSKSTPKSGPAPESGLLADLQPFQAEDGGPGDAARRQDDVSAGEGDFPWLPLFRGRRQSGPAHRRQAVRSNVVGPH